jgi:DNA-binding CsgD family transcriptional regulator
MRDAASPPAQIDLLRQRHPALSQGEAEIAMALLGGTTPEQIARQRGVSLSAVRTQIASILRKTNCHSVAAFVAVSRVFIF